MIRGINTAADEHKPAPAQEPAKVPDPVRKILPLLLFLAIGLCSMERSRKLWVVSAAVMALVLAGSVLMQSYGAFS